MQNSQTRRDLFKLTATGVLSGSLATEVTSASGFQNDSELMSPAQLRGKLVECLGGTWPDPCQLNPQIRETIHKNGYRIESVTYEVEPGERIAAYLLIPDGVDAKNPAPAVAVWHQHAGKFKLGKTEPAGLGGDPMHHTGAALAKEGYVTLCPDALCLQLRRLDS